MGNAVPYAAEPTVPAGVSVLQGVVHDIHIAVITLAHSRGLYHRVSADEPPDFRIIQPCIHMDESEIV